MHSEHTLCLMTDSVEYHSPSVLSHFDSDKVSYRIVICHRKISVNDPMILHLLLLLLLLLLLFLLLK